MLTRADVLFFGLARRLCCIGQKEGIRICDFAGEPQRHEAFLAKTAEALDLLRTADPRRFRRVQRYVSCIGHVASAQLGGVARYDLVLHICYVCAGYFIGEAADVHGVEQQANPSGERDCGADLEGKSLSAAIYYAAILVHEATHGALQARGISHSRENILRIERLCLLEARRFAARRWPWFADWLPQEPDEEFLMSRRRF